MQKYRSFCPTPNTVRHTKDDLLRKLFVFHQKPLFGPLLFSLEAQCVPLRLRVFGVIEKCPPHTTSYTSTSFIPPKAQNWVGETDFSCQQNFTIWRTIYPFHLIFPHLALTPPKIREWGETSWAMKKGFINCGICQQVFAIDFYFSQYASSCLVLFVQVPLLRHSQRFICISIPLKPNIPTVMGTIRIPPGSF